MKSPPNFNMAIVPDMITKMWRAMPFPSSSDKSPGFKHVIHRIDRVPTADKYRVVYSISHPRAIEIPKIDLLADFDYAMQKMARTIQADKGIDKLEEEILIEASL